MRTRCGGVAAALQLDNASSSVNRRFCRLIAVHACNGHLEKQRCAAVILQRTRSKSQQQLCIRSRHAAAAVAYTRLLASQQADECVYDSARVVSRRAHRLRYI